jgi:hypothetical protein
MHGVRLINIWAEVWIDDECVKVIKAKNRHGKYDEILAESVACQYFKSITGYNPLNLN